MLWGFCRLAECKLSALLFNKVQLQVGGWTTWPSGVLSNPNCYIHILISKELILKEQDIKITINYSISLSFFQGCYSSRPGQARIHTSHFFPWNGVLAHPILKHTITVIYISNKSCQEVRNHLTLRVAPTFGYNRWYSLLLNKLGCKQRTFKHRAKIRTVYNGVLSTQIHPIIAMTGDYFSLNFPLRRQLRMF